MNKQPEARFMLREIAPASQVPGGPHRRWFTDNALDLIVWYADDATPSGFQLCYMKGCDEHALTWTRLAGFAHNRIDDGDIGGGGHKMSPILVPDGALDSNTVLTLFRNAAKDVEPAISRLVEEKLESLATRGETGTGRNGRA